MTVQELITKLNEFSADREILVKCEKSYQSFSIENVHILVSSDPNRDQTPILILKED